MTFVAANRFPYCAIFTEKDKKAWNIEKQQVFFFSFSSLKIGRTEKDITMKTLLSTIIICLLRKPGHVGAPRPETRDPRPETRDPRPETKNAGQGDIQSNPSVFFNDLFQALK